MLEGTVATVPPHGGYKHPAQPGVPFDTTNVLFICGGAFVGLEEIIAKRLGRGGFGFGRMSENRQVAGDGLLRQVKPEDLEQFGLIPEIIGRLPVIAPLDALGVQDLQGRHKLFRGVVVHRDPRVVHEPRQPHPVRLQAFQSPPARWCEIGLGQFRLHPCFHLGHGLPQAAVAVANAAAPLSAANRLSFSR